jgi:toxin ParE1/3/4
VRIRRFPRAIRDADEILGYIAADNVAAAERFAERLVRATDRLAGFPESGAPHPEIGDRVRGIVVARYLVLYRVGPDSVDILRILHGARDLTALLGSEGEE